MNSIEPKIIEHLSDYTLYPDEAPASAVIPFVVFSITGDTPDDSLDHSQDVRREVLTLEYHAEDYEAARIGADELERQMILFSGATVYSENPDSGKTDRGHFFSRDYSLAYAKFTSDYPECSTGLCWFDRHRNVFTDVEGTVRANLGQRVALWKSVGGSWTDRIAVQATEANRTRLSLEGVEAYMDTLPVSLPFSGTSGKYFNLNSTMSLNGEFTIYSIHFAAIMPVEPYAGVSILGGQVAYPHWYYQPDCFLNFGSGWFRYCRMNGYAGHYSTEGWSIDTPYIFTRTRRRYEGGRWKWYVQMTNTPERYTNTNDGWTFPFNYLMHTGISATQAPPSGFHLKQLVICNEDATKTSLDTEIRNKLFELEGITL